MDDDDSQPKAPGPDATPSKKKKRGMLAAALYMGATRDAVTFT